MVQRDVVRAGLYVVYPLVYILLLAYIPPLVYL